jgi:NAD(P)H-dependent flavin oxidoreductase YrpB (nitropropane dioxygenase family)
MLKTRITEQYGLKVPFINAGIAFIATAPLVRAVCNAGGMGMLGIPAMPPPTCCKRQSAMSKP